VDGRFFLDTEGGKETYRTVKNLGELQEWSYGFDILKESYGEFDDRSVRFLEALDVHEVSPVMLGAGIGTHTTAIKGTAPQTGDAQDDAGQDDGQGAGDGVDPGGPPPRVVLTLIDIDELEV
jgi:phage head maturation protease